MLFPWAINRSNLNVVAQTGYIDIFQGQFPLNLVSFFYLSLYYRSNALKMLYEIQYYGINKENLYWNKPFAWQKKTCWIHEEKITSWRCLQFSNQTSGDNVTRIQCGNNKIAIRSGDQKRKGWRNAKAWARAMKAREQQVARTSAGGS